jgi:tungstate transport system permease protein
MDFFFHGFQDAWSLLTQSDSYLWTLTWVTLKIAGISTVVALAIGLPLGLLIGLGRFRGRGLAAVLANLGLGLPPVVVGLVLALLMFPAAPLGRFQLLFTYKGVIVAQTCLAFPIIVALTSSAVREIAPGLLAQADAFGARRHHRWLLALAEARIGVMAATIAAVGSALSEVGAIVLVGGNIRGVDQTLASAALEQVEAGHFADGLAIAIILLGLILIITALLTVLQYGRAERRVGASS